MLPYNILPLSIILINNLHHLLTIELNITNSVTLNRKLESEPWKVILTKDISVAKPDKHYQKLKEEDINKNKELLTSRVN